jgi:Mg-chelatase subunit ChlI
MATKQTGIPESVLRDNIIAEFENRTDVLADWHRQAADMQLKLQEVGNSENAANQLLASEGAKPGEVREAEEVLASCAVRRRKIADGLERASAAIARLDKELAALRPQYECEQHRIRAGAALASRMRQARSF